MNQKPSAGWVVCGIVWTIVGIIFAVIGLNPAIDSVALVAIGCIVALLGLVFTIKQIVKIKKYTPSAYEEGTLYRLCAREGITDLSSASKVKKAELIAQNHKIAFSNIVDAFEKSRIAEECFQKQISGNSVRFEEDAQYKKIMEYSTLEGKQKRIAMLQDIRQQELEAGHRNKSIAQTFERQTKEGQHNWAVAGGVASAIAGPVAGVVVAADVQMRNAEARARNATRDENLRAVSLEEGLKAGAHYMSAEKIEEQINRTNNLLVSDISKKEVFDYLQFKKTKVEISESGRFHVKTTVAYPEKIVIFDDIEAVIDGSLICEIYDSQKECVSKVMIILPLWGINTDEIELESFSLDEGNSNEKYSCVIKPHHLWAMEP